VDPEPDFKSGTEKGSTEKDKVKKFHVLKCWMLFLWGLRLLFFFKVIPGGIKRK
jgi:hypothetical protein